MLGALYAGAWPFALLAAAAAIRMQWEFYEMVRLPIPASLRALGMAMTVVVILLPLVPDLWAPGLLLLVILLGLIPFRSDDDPVGSFSAAAFGVFYPGSLLAFLVLLRAHPGIDAGGGGFLIVLFVLLFVWATDIGAYYIGKSFGRRKLIPRVSPNKTWEGAIGGTATALLVAVVLALFGVSEVGFLSVIGLALVCSVTGQVGDLIASRLKRAAGVKDAGSLLPGHGGLLDRLDALLLAAPAAYLYLVYLAGF